MVGVKGWVTFPSAKKEPQRRKLWEQRCKRGINWKATRNHAICSKHFREWKGKKPSPEYPDPECFEYNNWGKLPAPRRKNILQVNKSFADTATAAATTATAAVTPTLVRRKNIQVKRSFAATIATVTAAAVTPTFKPGDIFHASELENQVHGTITNANTMDESEVQSSDQQAAYTLGKIWRQQ